MPARPARFVPSQARFHPRRAKAIVGRFLFVALLLGGVDASSQESDPPPSEDAPSTRTVDEERALLRMLADSLEHIESSYVNEDVDQRRLVEAAIRGMLSELDPYSAFIAPEEMDGFRRGMESRFAGVGIQVVQEGDHLRIISPIYGTPAYRAGILAGDHVIRIGEESTRDMTVDEASQLVTGEPGTSVTLTVFRPHDESVHTMELEREVIRIETVVGYRRDEEDAWDFFVDRDAGIAYVRVVAFSRQTPSELRRRMHALLEMDMQGCVLDLRFNPGGLLTAAVDVCDLFLDGGTIVSTEGRNAPHHTWEAQQPGTLPDFPLAVLVNGYSASASEIVAACLQDHERGWVVGERTWGKASVQNVIPLDDGNSAIKLTTAGYFRPSGRNIDRLAGAQNDGVWGVEPRDETLRVELTSDQVRDLQRFQRFWDIVGRPGEEPDEEPEEELAEFEDPQLQAAVARISAHLEPAAEPGPIPNR